MGLSLLEETSIVHMHIYLCIYIIYIYTSIMYIYICLYTCDVKSCQVASCHVVYITNIYIYIYCTYVMSCLCNVVYIYIYIYIYVHIHVYVCNVMQCNVCIHKAISIPCRIPDAVGLLAFRPDGLRPLQSAAITRRG